VHFPAQLAVLLAKDHHLLEELLDAAKVELCSNAEDPVVEVRVLAEAEGSYGCLDAEDLLVARARAP